VSPQQPTPHLLGLSRRSSARALGTATTRSVADTKSSPTGRERSARANPDAPTRETVPTPSILLKTGNRKKSRGAQVELVPGLTSDGIVFAVGWQPAFVCRGVDTNVATRQAACAVESTDDRG
jgi:hypothetical protein